MKAHEIVSCFRLAAFVWSAGVGSDGRSQRLGLSDRRLLSVWRDPGVSLESAVQRVALGEKPFQPGREIDQEQRREFERFVDLARKKGVALVGITEPFVPALVEALDRSPQHEIWREFQKPEFADWVRRQGVIYFNFTRLESFGGKADEFADPFHPSEPADLRMLLTMQREPAFRALFPKLDPSLLEARLKQASPLEVYRNEF
jgi:hypothetical protein